MRQLMIALAFFLLDLNAPANPARDAEMYIVKLPYGVELFVSDNGTATIVDDFVFDFDVKD